MDKSFRVRGGILMDKSFWVRGILMSTAPISKPSGRNLSRLGAFAPLASIHVANSSFVVSSATQHLPTAAHVSSSPSNMNAYTDN